MLHATIQRDFDAWRTAARGLLCQSIHPDEVIWSTDEDEKVLPLFTAAPLAGDFHIHRVPKPFLDACRFVACHRDPQRWGLMYRLLWRLTHGESALLQIVTDDEVHQLLAMEKAVRRDRHKMTAFVRFREVIGENHQKSYIAWHRPDHYIVRLTAPFFRDRFSVMNWTILTPDDSVSWDGHQLCFAPGVPASQAPAPDELEALWRTYYGSIFNPARIKLKAMRKEMPVRHWATLPETQIIDDLLREAPQRMEAMMKATSACPNTNSAADFLPQRITLPQLREASKGCRGCDLYCNATQTVFGAGPSHALVMFVGEQPGDQEDLAGKPFVGPAGQVLDEGMEQAGIPRDEVYVTNAVKHFKFEPRGKRRIHAKPNAREIKACRPWLESEIQVVKPRIIVALGATAAQSLMGPSFRLTQQRGEFFQDTQWAKSFMATYHPSALLRMPDEKMRHQAKADFVADLKLVAKQIRTLL